ncbi:PEP-CTERM sorting domain-containing protein [bacterium]|nr:PEP-CTERM sorting domain-containing protein [bacterium]
MDERNKIFDLSQSKNIETIYLYADYFNGAGYAGNDIIDNPQLYRSFISDAHSRGLEVHALLGSAALETWNYFLPEKRTDALAMISHVLDYNSSSSATKNFDGFNVDIEPYISSEWWSSQPTYSKYYMDMLSEQKQLITASGQNMLFGPVIPRWYDNESGLNIEWNGTTKNLLYHIMDLSDYITVMDYRNITDQIINDALNELIYGDIVGTEVAVGIETAPTGEGPYVSFYGKKEKEMETVLAPAETVFETYSSYAGIAVHNYDSYYTMTVPEPTTLVLLLISFTGFLSIKKRFIFKK